MKTNKRYTIIALMAAAAALFAVGCKEQAASSTSASESEASSAPVSNTVKIAYPNWAEGIAMTHLIKGVIEDKLGYDVELTQADPGTIYTSLANGGEDIMIDAWLPNTHKSYWDKYGENLEDFGPVYGYGVTGLVVPAYMDVNSIEDLNGIADELDGKIVGIGTGAGIYANTNKAIDTYDLKLEQIASSGPAMTAALQKAIEAKQPIVVTGWKPHWMFSRFDLKVLKDPQGVYPIDAVKVVGREGFAKDYPDLAQLFINYSLTEAQLLDLMDAISEAGSSANPDDVARDWMARNEPLVGSWLPN
ncbi:glycine betaine ABC transporter substrate-binding protein [Ruficoccus sp. ZRK36]|uniref:glycine betaine ABC transporter substrate-binding protein n=1 Tax=Ruficoccus sp. ZRK36 TaxID=2866311 RepID=UPI001C72E44C|nr:glycine betaine ABC transporter substrate-binding protein [Ruficoccus sp. ZRK36]QYY36754.1 glycine betaine ABC transporter substrate-binding protein [Ruficoccus sp. ZRK36]